MNEIAPPPKYRLNLRVVLMSVLIWMGTFLVFAAISVTLAITTNAMYFLFIIMGLVVSTFAMAFYKPEGPWEPLVPYSRLCEPRLETHAPVYVEEKSAVYPPSPSVKSVTRSDPWLCTSAKTTLRGSFSSPRLRSQVDDTWPAAAAPARNPLPSGFLPLVPAAVARSHSSTRLDSPSQCEQVTTVSCHQAYGCYESRVLRTTYEEFHRVSDNVEMIECIERSEVVTTETAAAPSPEPPSTTIQVEEPVEPVVPEKKKRRLLWNIFSRSDDKTVVKEFPAYKNEDSESKAGLLEEESFAPADTPCFSKASRGIADAPEFSKVVANIERNIHEANNPYTFLHKPKADGGGTAAASQKKSSSERKVAKKGTFEGEQAAAAKVMGILNSSESSASSSGVGGATAAASGLPSFWKEQTSPPPDDPSPGSSSPMVSGPASSGLSSGGSRISLAGSTPKDADQQYLNEAFIKSRSSWDERSHPDSTTPFRNNLGEGSTSQSSSQRTAASKMAASSTARSEEKEIWASPSWSPARNSSNAVGEKASQTSLRDYCPQSSGDDHFRMSPLVKADLVEVTVINNPAPTDKGAGSSRCALQCADGAEKPQPSKYVQATSKTIETGVQMVTCDGDNNSPTKKSKKKKLKLLPRFLKVKKKK
ncbi:uncharacterized protein LOC142577713 [Dermacentor variabilis]|uniref:uncharacterized protein LOC142577713 n=1 Tax=Dermacentor variabilis TaxID=34621 RepID=UPI003F5C86B2